MYMETDNYKAQFKWPKTLIRFDIKTVWPSKTSVLSGCNLIIQFPPNLIKPMNVFICSLCLFYYVYYFGSFVLFQATSPKKTQFSWVHRTITTKKRKVSSLVVAVIAIEILQTTAHTTYYSISTYRSFSKKFVGKLQLEIIHNLNSIS